MLKVGLTGGIGSGKTAVSDLFKNLGIPIIDTDIISRQLLDNDQDVINAIVDNFGQSILDNNKSIDRKKLANIIFFSNDRKQQLETILHPRIRSQVKQLIEGLDSNITTGNYIIIVVPLLFETGFSELIDRSLVVLAKESIRIKRVQQRDNRSIDEIQSIISHQVDDLTRHDKADDTIENNNDIKQLEDMVRNLHVQYQELSNTV